MKQSEQINELMTAIAAARPNFKSIKKSKTATIKTRAGGEYSYNYCTLHDLQEATAIPLAEQGVTVIQSVTTRDGKMLVSTELAHSGGQWVRAVLPMPLVGSDRMNAVQAMGSQMTYLCRYAQCAMLNVSGEEDTDGEGLDGDGRATGSKGKAKGSKGGATSRGGSTTSTTPTSKDPPKKQPPKKPTPRQQADDPNILEKCKLLEEETIGFVAAVDEQKVPALKRRFAGIAPTDLQSRINLNQCWRKKKEEIDGNGQTA